jgi:hypothetical protein
LQKQAPSAAPPTNEAFMKSLRDNPLDISAPPLSELIFR